MNTEIEKLSTDLATRAAGIVVKDQASADAANELIKAGKAVIKEIKTFFELRKAKAYDLWKYECNDEKAWLSKVEPVIAVLDKALTSWTLAEQRKRREAEEAARRAEEERQRLEAETLRKVKEAEEAAERDRLRLEREAEELQKKEREALAAGDKAALAEVETKREEIPTGSQGSPRHGREGDGRRDRRSRQGRGNAGPHSGHPGGPTDERLLCEAQLFLPGREQGGPAGDIQDRRSGLPR